MPVWTGALRRETRVEQGTLWQLSFCHSLFATYGRHCDTYYWLPVSESSETGSSRGAEMWSHCEVVDSLWNRWFQFWLLASCPACHFYQWESHQVKIVVKHIHTLTRNFLHPIVDNGVSRVLWTEGLMSEMFIEVWFGCFIQLLL